MSAQNYCGCKNVHPAAREFKRCTKKPNSHLQCYPYEPPTLRLYPCGRQSVIHVIEQIHPASSTVRQGNCPNHRSEEYWYINGKQITKPKTGGRGPRGDGPSNLAVK
ncbi:hypothetical protein PV11_00030 [Exophiala sideris]|uniref:Uncharacterized protein n=1 Tax=Exophiala sideris TaxID=1016849 RepID=A0A0D1YS25_9EURO|nr:hypothetical protein PV11_00030 [Exophiala sideris]